MRITIDVKIDFHKFKYESLEKLVNLKLEKIVFEKYGSHERDMKKIADTGKDDLRAHWDRYMALLMKGKNKFFLSLSTSRSGQISGGGGADFSVKALNSMHNDIETILATLNENDALIFASFNSEEIHDQKHKVVTKFESGGSAYGWEGASDREFLDFLPGIGWFTFFGTQYVQCIGEEKLRELRDTEIIDLKGAIAIRHRKTIDEVSLAELEEVEHEIGSQYFYSKKRKTEELHHPEGFKDYLVSLEDEFNRKYP